ncbi:MAG: cytochrome c biogenesis protein CcdA, partial [Dehalococcoidales bacterium]|nr:cytochrome c biogenesis protein CcdA [Dehalococcoidales bacterium]
LIILGLFMMAALKVPWLNYEGRLNLPLATSKGYLRSFLTGSIFTVAWTPCVGPMLGGIITLAGSSGTVWTGTYLLALYSLGLGVPFLAIGIAFDFIAPLLKSINRYSNWIYIFSGLLLIIVGILILMNRLFWF